MIELMPNWTSGGAWTLGRDPLGIQATSVRMYRSLVPGLTNVTNRLRYYSFYCWVIERYEAIEHSGDVERWSRFIRRAEALFALGCNLADADEADGLAGNIWARKVVKGVPSGNFDIRPATDDYAGAGQYLGAKRGNFGQFYIASMTEEKFLAPSVTIPIVSASGRRAAAAFRDAVGDAADRLHAAIRDGAASSQYYGWSKEFLEAGKRRLAGDTARAATPSEVKELRLEAKALKEVVADLTFENRLLKRSMTEDGDDEALAPVDDAGRGRHARRTGRRDHALDSAFKTRRRPPHQCSRRSAASAHRRARSPSRLMALRPAHPA